MPDYNLFTDDTASFKKFDYQQTHLPAEEIQTPAWFMHARATSRPTEPDTSGLSAPELAEVEAWKDGLVIPTLPDAVTYVADYLVYLAADDAWKLADYWAKRMQFRGSGSDAQGYNRDSVSVSGTPSGSGDSPPPPSTYPRNDP